MDVPGEGVLYWLHQCRLQKCDIGRIVEDIIADQGYQVAEQKYSHSIKSQNEI